MAQPSKSTAKLADATDNPQIGDRGSAVTAAAAATYAAPSVTVETLTENSGQGTPNTTIVDVTGGVTDNSGSGLDAGAKTEIDALFVLCDDNFADLADQQSKLRVDNAATLVEVDDLADDVALIRTALNALIDRLEAHGLIADN